MNSYYVYILECADTSLYVGSTNDVARRVDQHNNSKRGARYTKARRPVVLKYTEAFLNVGVALRREAEIKSWKREQKLALISSNPIS